MKTIVYVDAANLIKSCQQHNLNYDNFLFFNYLKGKFRANECKYFTANFDYLHDDLEEFKSYGIQIILKQVYREENKVKSNCLVDITKEIVLDIENKKVDRIVLVSGDGNFLPLLQYAKLKNINVNLFSIHPNRTSRLYRSSKKFTPFYLTQVIYLLQKDSPKGKALCNLEGVQRVLFSKDSIATPKKLSSRKFRFEIQKRSSEFKLMRAGRISTPHGEILTPCFVPVGTKATVKALTVNDVKNAGGQTILANTYHLYLQPGKDIVEKAGGFAKFMNYDGPTWTDSGGFQVLSLGAAFNSGVTKIATDKSIAESRNRKGGDVQEQMANIDEDGVTFKSFIDGSKHRFTPEISMQIQHSLGADIFFAFDECTSPLATREYQVSAMDRTHRWAKRCIDEHKKLGLSSATGEQQALFAVVQGSGYEDLRKQSAEFLSAMDFDGFGIGGSFTKADIDRDVKAATQVLPENKPRHLLGIGEPHDFFTGVECGIDTFDCVIPTRVGRHGQIFTDQGKININTAKYKIDFTKITEDKSSPLFPYTHAYIAHLFRADEILGAMLVSQHNLYFLISTVGKIRQSILDNNYSEFKKAFLEKFYKKTTSTTLSEKGE